MNFDPTTLSNTVLVITAFSAAFLAALWLSLIFWVYSDMRKRSRDSLTRVLSALVVAVLFLPGVLIYLILRPQHTIEEEYQRTLEEEALLQSIEESPLCPGCGRHVRLDWMLCPYCHTKLKKNCNRCNRPLDLPWDICPYCGMVNDAPPVVESEDEQSEKEKPVTSLMDFLAPELSYESRRGPSVGDISQARRDDEKTENERNQTIDL